MRAPTILQLLWPGLARRYWRHELVEHIADGPKERAAWLALGYADVAEARWLQPGQALYADGVLHLPRGMVLPDGWQVWPFAPAGALAGPAAGVWQLAWERAVTS